MNNPCPPLEALVFGASGEIGRAIADTLETSGLLVTRATSDTEKDEFVLVPGASYECPVDLKNRGPFDAVVWAQGLNANDSVESTDLEIHNGILNANLHYVSRTLSMLLANGKVNHGSRMVVVSSIWEEVARPNKFSYTISKSALGGLVRAASVDLASKGILINGVLPGVVDTQMTRSVLTSDQLEQVKYATPFARLVTPSDVASVVSFLCSDRNTAITGQSIAIDLGFSLTRMV